MYFLKHIKHSCWFAYKTWPLICILWPSLSIGKYSLIISLIITSIVIWFLHVQYLCIFWNLASSCKFESLFKYLHAYSFPLHSRTHPKFTLYTIGMLFTGLHFLFTHPNEDLKYVIAFLLLWHNPIALLAFLVVNFDLNGFLPISQKECHFLFIDAEVFEKISSGHTLESSEWCWVPLFCNVFP